MLATVALIATLPGCAHNLAQEEAGRAADVLVEHPTVVLAPISVPSELDVSPETLAHLDSLILRRLSLTPLRVLGPETYLAEWDSAVQRHSGLVLAETGALPADRQERARHRFAATLNRKFGEPILVFPELEIVDAPFEGTTAKWDGKSQRIPGTGNWLSDFGGAVVEGVFASLTGIESEKDFPTGHVRALSLGVYLETVEGDEVYRRRVGIEVLVKAQDGGFVFLEQTLGDRTKRAEAVDAALDPITEATREQIPLVVSQAP